MIELSTEDRERIEQEAKVFAYQFNTTERTDISHRSYVFGAEYATKYERRQQAKELGEATENVNYGSPEHLRYVIRKLKAEKEKLEAERTELQELIKNLHLKVGQERQEKEAQRLAAIELRNKVIDECVERLMYKSDLFQIFRDDDWEAFNEAIRERLNSLKK